jgi:hypothetical protein
MPEKFSLRFADYFEGDDPDRFGLTPDAADYLVIFCQRVQRSPSLTKVAGRTYRSV